METIGTLLPAPIDSGDVTIRNRVRLPMRLSDGSTVRPEIITFSGLTDNQEHVALVFESSRGSIPLVRLHSECLTGDAFGSARCDCGPQLDEGLRRISDAGGVLLYLRQEGRGIGLYNKLAAYALQDAGLDTYAANIELGFGADQRDYRAAAQMLRALGVDQFDLLSNNPDKAAQLRDLGMSIRHVQATGVFQTRDNRDYLRAKIEQTGHLLTLDKSLV